MIWVVNIVSIRFSIYKNKIMYSCSGSNWKENREHFETDFNWVVRYLDPKWIWIPPCYEKPDDEPEPFYQELLVQKNSVLRGFSPETVLWYWFFERLINEKLDPSYCFPLTIITYRIIKHFTKSWCWILR